MNEAQRWAAFREVARYIKDDSRIDFDVIPDVSESEEGAYVAAWIWVSNEEAGIETEEIDEEAEHEEIRRAESTIY